MELRLSDDQVMLADTFARFFANESTVERVRAAESTGFDPDLWQKLVALGSPAIRVADIHGGSALGLRDVAVVAEQAGRHIAAAPVVEAAVSAKILSDAGTEAAVRWLEKLLNGSTIVSPALQPAQLQPRQVIPFGVVADAAITLFDDELVLLQAPDPRPDYAENLSSQAIARWDLDSLDRLSLCRGQQAKDIYHAAIEEWKLLCGAKLNGISARCLEYAAEYGRERTAFGVQIGTFQGLAHPLADCATNLDGSRLLLDYAIWKLEQGQEDAGGHISMAYWWATEVSSQTMPQCVHIFGGYGVSEEHDIQLFARRGMALTSLLGDRQQELLTSARRLWAGETSALPAAGDSGLDFDPGPAAAAMTDKVNQFFAQHLTDEHEAYRGHSWDGYHEDIYKKLGQANLLFPSWPKEYGGLDAKPAEQFAIAKAYYANRWTNFPQNTSHVVGEMILEFGSDKIKEEILPQLVNGEALMCLGLTEPHCGSDVFAARTKAVRKGDKWVINGQKMFTSGAHISKFVMLLTNTDPDAPKHVGKTLFLVPLDHPGVEIHRVDTISADRTNITYYTDVELSDDYRLGDVNAGSKVMGYMLSKEQGLSAYGYELRHMITQAVEWARNTQRDGRPVINDPLAQVRLARAYIDYRISELMCLRIVHNTEKNMVQRHHASMLKAFITEAWKANGAELINVAAPDSLFSHTADLNYVEEGWRSSLASCIYAGTTQVHRSVVAEVGLGLPRSRLK